MSDDIPSELNSFLSAMESWGSGGTEEGAIDSSLALAECKSIEASADALIASLEMGGASIGGINSLISKSESLFSHIRWEGPVPDESLDWPALRATDTQSGSSQVSIHGEPSAEAYQLSVSRSGTGPSVWSFQMPRDMGYMAVSAAKDRNGNWMLNAMTADGDSNEWFLKPGGDVLSREEVESRIERDLDGASEAFDRAVDTTIEAEESRGSTVPDNAVGDLLADSPEEAALWGGGAIIPGVTAAVLTMWQKGKSTPPPIEAPKTPPPIPEAGQKAPPPVQAGGPSPPRLPQETKCHACGAPMEPNARFCGHCGTPRAQSCPSCGTAITRKAKFCPHCGHRLPTA